MHTFLRQKLTFLCHVSLFAARHRTSGKLVAIKVISIKPTEWDQLRSVWRECQLMTTINSEGCIKVITYYSARIAHRGIVSKAWSKFNPVASGYEEVELAPEMMQEPDSRKSPVKKSAPKRADPVTSVSGSLVASRSASVASATGSVSAASATFSAYESDVSYPLPDAMSQPEGSEINSMGLQVHMVMPFADCGTLYDAVRANKLRNPDGSAKLVSELWRSWMPRVTFH